MAARGGAQRGIPGVPRVPRRGGGRSPALLARAARLRRRRRPSAPKPRAVTLAVARTIAEMPDVAAAVTAGSDADATAALQPIAERIMDETPHRLRHDHDHGRHPAHPSATPPRSASRYLGTIAPASPVARSPRSPPARSGRRVRIDRAGDVGRRGRRAGRRPASRSAASAPASCAQLPFVIAIADRPGGASGSRRAWLARRVTRRIAGDLPGERRARRGVVVRVASARSARPCARRPTSTATGCTPPSRCSSSGAPTRPIGILTETSRQSQALVDQVAARRDGDPTVGALLLGKAAQARERGVDWTARDRPGGSAEHAARPVDAVSVVGNLIDNAMDAAAAGPEPRWVRVVFAPGAGRRARALGLGLAARGVPAELRERIFEHGFSTKPAGARGPRRRAGARARRSWRRPAARSTSTADPTTFQVILPGRQRMIHVLLVDDDALTLELHRTYVERLDGFRVVAECTGARAAVSAILERPPAEGIDLVLLDMTMPDGTGLDVLPARAGAGRRCRRHRDHRGARRRRRAPDGRRSAWRSTSSSPSRSRCSGSGWSSTGPTASARARRVGRGDAGRDRRDARRPAAGAAAAALPKGLSADTLERVTAELRATGRCRRARPRSGSGCRGSPCGATSSTSPTPDSSAGSPLRHARAARETEYRWRAQ